VNPLSYKQKSLVIVYDADRLDQPPTPGLFLRDHWEHQGAVVGQAKGRGNALLLETSFGPAVLRQYLRGGWPAHVSDDRYLFTGFDRSRPVREFHMLVRLCGLRLPVPAPIAAQCLQDGPFYRGWLLMDRIVDAMTVADLLDRAPWRDVGAALARFHAAGVVHADLNARNILAGPAAAVHLVDFDRARISPGNRAAFRSNLNRLKRSLEKLWPDRAARAAGWEALMTGYREAAGA
jgi:3-deoxy-D-manno-octulosonic acid kinase